MTPLRLVGVEDGSFEPFTTGAWAYLCAVRMLDLVVDEVRIGKAAVDGVEVTDTLLGMLHDLECEAVILGGVTFAGFNVVDAQKLSGALGVPVVIFSAVRPDSDSVLAALKAHFGDWEERWSPIERLGGVQEVETREGHPPVFFEVVGASPEWAADVLRGAVGLSRAPECVRVAGIVARGLGRCTGP